MWIAENRQYQKTTHALHLGADALHVVNRVEHRLICGYFHDKYFDGLFDRDLIDFLSELKMKFAEHLSAHITPEWRKQYINYEVSVAVYINIVLLKQQRCLFITRVLSLRFSR